jgi:tight adherence protein C
MLYLILLSAFLSVFLLVSSILGTVMRRRLSVRIRLESLAAERAGRADSELDQPLFSRVLRPMLDSLSKTVMKVAPKEITASLEKKILMAGAPKNMTVKDWINLQVLMAVGLPAASLAAGYFFGAKPGGLILFIIAEIALSLVLPGFILGKCISERQKKVRNSLPDVIDLLTVSVEAGLGFDGALVKVVDKMPGPLASEFDRVLQEIKVGRQKKDALRDMAERMCIQDLTTFVSSVVQADQFGVSIGNVLRLQSEQMRQKRRQSAQEKALKAPVKMVIPMVVFIFPTLFSVLLGPVVIQLLDQF